MSLCMCTKLSIQIQETKSLHTPLPAMLHCVCYDLSPGVRFKPPKKGKDKWGSREFSCSLWLYNYPAAPNLGSRFSSSLPIGVIKLRMTGVGTGAWPDSGHWRIEQGEWGVGSSYGRCFLSYHRCRSDHLTSPWPPRPSPTRRIRKLTVIRI